MSDMASIGTPTVSVVIPVYNAVDYLDDCLSSIAIQSFRNIEVICVDDGSTDNSPNILKRYAEEDHRFLTITQENRGVSAARNRALDKARGDLIIFVDSDDMLAPGGIQVMYDAWDKSGSEIVCGGDVQRDLIRGITKERYLESGCYHGPENLQLVMTHAVPWVPWAKLIPRRLFEKNKIRFPEQQHHGEDYLVISRVFDAAERVRLIPDIVYERTHHMGSLTTGWQNEEFVRHCVRGRALLKRWLEENGRWTEFQEAFAESAYVMFRTTFLLKLIIWARGTAPHSLRMVVDCWNSMLPDFAQTEAEVLNDIIHVLRTSITHLETLSAGEQRGIAQYVCEFIRSMPELERDLLTHEQRALTDCLNIGKEGIPNWSLLRPAGCEDQLRISPFRRVLMRLQKLGRSTRMEQ